MKTGDTVDFVAEVNVDGVEGTEKILPAMVVNVNDDKSLDLMVLAPNYYGVQSADKDERAGRFLARSSSQKSKPERSPDPADDRVRAPSHITTSSGKRQPPTSAKRSSSSSSKRSSSSRKK